MSFNLPQIPVQRHKHSRLPYQYRYLDRPGKEIRLLKVLPGSKEEPLRAKFVSEFLSDNQIDRYETISYAWGDPTQRGEIEVDGSIIDIPASSDAALRCMRRRDVCRRLWIDSVCIEQDDDLEKSFQVKMMGEVYRRSSHNLVYLGEEDASTKSAVASIGRALDELNIRMGISENFDEFLDRCGPPMQCDIDLAAVFHFFKRPWFSRMWVIQEVVFAPSTTCYCGTEICISLLDLLRASSYIQQLHPSSLEVSGYSDLATSLHKKLEKCERLLHFVDAKKSLGARLDEDGSTKLGETGLLGLMQLGRRRRCADPRDKIFSIVGLMVQARAKTPREDRADLALLEVDYGKSLKDVLRDATRFYIQQSRNLEIWNEPSLNFSAQSGEILLDGFCSWAPRRGGISQSRSNEGGVHAVRVGCRASAGLPVRRETALATTLDSDVLTLDGYTVCEVVEVSQPLGAELFKHDARLANTLKSIRRMCCGVVSPDPTRPNGFPESLARTVAVSPYQGVRRDHGIFPEMRKHMCSVYDDDLRNSESGYWSHDMRLIFVMACSNRRVFAGSDGFIGQGPRCLRAGDRIVVLLGGDIPFAVRPLPGGDGSSGQRYHLLGSAYVYGAMYGEFVEAAMACGKEPSAFHFV